MVKYNGTVSFGLALRCCASKHFDRETRANKLKTVVRIYIQKDPANKFEGELTFFRRKIEAKGNSVKKKYKTQQPLIAPTFPPPQSFPQVFQQKVGELGKLLSNSHIEAITQISSLVVEEKAGKEEEFYMSFFNMADFILYNIGISDAILNGDICLVRNNPNLQEDECILRLGTSSPSLVLETKTEQSILEWIDQKDIYALVQQAIPYSVKYWLKADGTKIEVKPVKYRRINI